MGPLDNTTATDDRASSNNNATRTTIINSPTYVGKKARRFNGVSDHIQIPDDATLRILAGGELSVFARVTPAADIATTNFKVIIGKESYAGNYWFTLWSLRQQFYVNSVFMPSSSTDVTRGISQSIGVSFDELNYVYYLNGAVDGSGVKAASFPASSTSNVVIAKTCRWQYQINIRALLNLFFLFNRVLSPAKFAALNKQLPDHLIGKNGIMVRKWASFNCLRTAHGAQRNTFRLAL